MIPWIPLSVLSDLSQPRTQPVADDVVPPRYPLGFSNVRAQVAPALVDLPARAPVGFGPTPEPAEPPAPRFGFRTELSFRRPPRADVVRADAGDGQSGDEANGSQPDLGHASPADDTATEPVAGYGDDLWPGEPVDQPAEEKTPFYKKEIGLFRRKAKPASEPEAPAAESVDEGEDAGRVYELDLDEVVPDADPAAPADETFDPDPEVVLASETDEVPAEVAIDEPVEVVADASPDQPAEVVADASSDEPAEQAEPAEKVEPAETEQGDLWGEADEAETVEDDVPVVAAAAAEPARKGRSVRLRSNGSKPKRARSGGRERSGRKVVGLKIGASQLAAAVVQQVDGRSELLHAARVPLEPGIVVDGDVKDQTALANALKSFFDDNRLPRKDVRIGLASNRIGVRTSDVVGIDDAERFDNAVRFKAHEVLPVAVHESVLDYRVIDERASENGESLRRVLLVVAPRDQVEPYLAVCKDAGLRLAGIDLEALGLLRAFVEPHAVRAADDTATVVVSIGHEASTLLVAGGGACEFTRVFDWGGGALQDAIANELDVHGAEAATILRHLALSGGGSPLASLDDEARQRAVDAVRSKLTPFARELVSSLQFYQTQPESLGIGEIVITGGTSHLAGLADALHQMIGVSVRVGDPLQRVVTRAALDPALEATVGSLAVPIGLAIEDDAVRSVNLLPGEMRQAGGKRPDLVKVALPVAAAASIAALGFLFMQANGTVSDRESDLQAVQAEIAALPKPKRPVIDPNVATTEAARAVALAGVLGGRLSWDGVFRDLSLVLPANVSLTRLEAQLPAPLTPTTTTTPAATPAPAVPTAPVAPTGVTIEGYTADQPAVALLLSRLRTVPGLTNVQLQSSTRELLGTKQIVRFIVLADIKQPGGVQ